MSSNLKRQMIHHLAEQGVPENHDPWYAVKTRLEESQAGRTLGQPSQSRAAVRLTLNRRLAGIAAALLALIAGAVFLFTPQGQVTAHNLIQLFRRAESNILPLASGQTTESVSTNRTPAPTQIAGLQPVPSGAAGAFFTPTPKQKVEVGSITYGLTLSEAEQLAQFSIRVPKALPAGYRLSEATYDSQARAVQQIYKYFPYQSGEMFVLSQQISAPADAIGQSAQVGQMQVNGTLVESVSGAWFAGVGSNVQQWFSDAPDRTYRWLQDGFYFTLYVNVGDTFSPAYLPPEDMQALVEALVGSQPARLTGAGLNDLKSIAEAEKTAGFHLLAPTFVPEGFTLERVVYEPENKRAVLIYRPVDAAGSMGNPSLVIYEVLKTTGANTTPALQSGMPPEERQTVLIGAVPGVFSHGILVDGVYDPDAALSLSWETENLIVNINYFGSAAYPTQLDKAGMVQIAEGMH